MKKLATLLLLSAISCTGTIDGGPGGGANNPDDPGDLTPPDCTLRGPRMTRRLTALQFRNTLVSAFQDNTVPDGDVLTDPVIHGFKADATQTVVRDLDAQLIMSYAETVGDWAATNKLNQLATCQNLDANCARQLIEKIGKRLYREPVPQASVDAYVELFLDEPTFADGARVVIAMMIQSPLFLYRRELGIKGDNGLYKLTPYEVASNLSYMLTNNPPDDQLMQAADEGRLATREDIDREALRLLDKPESAAAYGQFTRNWLEIDDLLGRAKIDPTNQLNDQIRQAMLEESTRFFLHVLRNNLPISELFTANYTFLNQQLASYYGVGGAGNDFQQVTLQPGQRPPGVMGHGAVLTRHALADLSSPVQRGKMVRERLLCETLTPPPPNVDANLPPPQNPTTTRARYEGHSQNAVCKGCHKLTDPIGFSLEKFDSFGRRRDQDNGFPIDTSGSLAGMREGDIPLTGADDLSAYLGRSPQVADCLVQYLSYVSYGLDSCNASEIQSEIAAGDGSLKSAILAITHAPHFTTRVDEE